MILDAGSRHAEGKRKKNFDGYPLMLRLITGCGPVPVLLKFKVSVLCRIRGEVGRTDRTSIPPVASVVEYHNTRVGGGPFILISDPGAQSVHKWTHISEHEVLPSASFFRLRPSVVTHH